VWQDRRQIEVRNRATTGWQSSVVGAGQRAHLGAPGCDLDVDAIYGDAGA
jgi:hypothetical protein